MACADVCGQSARERLEMGGEKDRWAGASVDARTCADGLGARERLEMGGEKDWWKGVSVDTRTCADSVGARERLEMGRERASGQERA